MSCIAYVEDPEIAWARKAEAAARRKENLLCRARTTGKKTCKTKAQERAHVYSLSTPIRVYGIDAGDDISFASKLFHRLASRIESVLRSPSATHDSRFVKAIQPQIEFPKYIRTNRKHLRAR